MADWRQIQARIRKAKVGADAPTKLAELYERTRDAMVAFELAQVQEKTGENGEAVRWYTTAAERFRRAQWRVKAEEALTRLGAPIPAPLPAETSETPPAETSTEDSPSVSVAAPLRITAPDDAEESDDSDDEGEEDSTEVLAAAAPGPSAAAVDPTKKRRRRGRRGGRGRRRGQRPGEAPLAGTRTAITPGSPAAADGAPPTAAPEPMALDKSAADKSSESEEEAPSFSRRPEIVPMTPVRRESEPRFERPMERPIERSVERTTERATSYERPSEAPAWRGRSSRAGEPALASRIAQLESHLRRLLACPLSTLDDADQAPAGPGVLLLSDSDQVTHYYIEACQTLRIGVGNLVRGNRTSRDTGRLKEMMAENLGIAEPRVAKYMKDHCAVRWLQLDEGAPEFAHFAIAVLRPVANE